MAEGFLGRWSRRKQEARAPEATPAAQAAVEPQPQPPAPQPVVRSAEPTPPADDAQPLPTLQDVQALTPESDFSGFVARGVAPEVRNAAMKKLFSDPHFNVMDGLDIYIDDYTQPTPLPLSTVRQLASAKVLGLVQDDEPQQQEQPQPGGAMAGQGAGALPLPPAAADGDVAQSPVRNAIPDTQVPHAPPQQGAQQAMPVSHTPDVQDADMRLQPDHASGPQGTGNGPA